jgi:uncharacterized protein with PIN domain
MIVYAETSAVLSWLLEESRATTVARVLAGATRVISSTLTRIECARTIARGEALGTFTPAAAKELARIYGVVEAGWEQMEIRDAVITKAGDVFPVEPIRALDAIHVASAALAHAEFGPVAMLSLDERVRSNAAALGLTVLPARA